MTVREPPAGTTFDGSGSGLWERATAGGSSADIHAAGRTGSSGGTARGGVWQPEARVRDGPEGGEHKFHAAEPATHGGGE